MARVLITGSTDGLGRATAEDLSARGHEVVVHARNADRLPALDDLTRGGASTVVGDLVDPGETRKLAEQVNALGPMDVVIHNAGLKTGPVLPVNVVAPYLLTCLLDRPQRSVFLSSGMHTGGRATLAGLDWTGRRRTASYSDSKFLLTALGLAVARALPDVQCQIVDPGWVRTRMGGRGAPGDLESGIRTQVRLATEPDIGETGGYWYHERRMSPDPRTEDRALQEALVEALARHTGLPL
jgi:NAD(P)-dependent dehydrogenase (short-subunit alcohol dehydrogenase family)